MASSLKDRVCVHCGQPAVDARVELNGTVTFFCAMHSPAVHAEDEAARSPGADHGKSKPNGG